MDFVHNDLKYRSSGDVVEVHLTGSAANVRLMTTQNFQRYRRGERHQYFGGLVQSSPHRLAIPHGGHWHLTVDMQGLRGRTSAQVRVIPGSTLRPLPPIAAQRPGIAEIARNLADTFDGETERSHDIFISHAGEDKDSLVRPLASALVEMGLDVWFDEFELRVGDSLRRRIDAGIRDSRFGIVVLSPAFFKKSWPQYELDGLVTMSLSGRQVLLPLWHEISMDEVISHSPSLADKVALRTSEYSIREIAEEIAHVVRRSSSSD